MLKPNMWKYLHIEKRRTFIFRKGTIQLVVSKKPNFEDNNMPQYLKSTFGSSIKQLGVKDILQDGEQTQIK